MLQNLYISGDLAGLILSYLDKFQLEQAEQRRRLHEYDANRRMTYQQWWDELSILSEARSKPDIGLELGACIQPEHCGVLGYLWLSSNTLLEAAFALERYQRLLYGGSPAVLDIQEGNLRCQWLPDNGIPNRVSDEVLISAIMHLGRQVTGNHTLSFTKVGFMHSEPNNKEDYEGYFGCEVQFNSPALFIEGDPAFLNESVSRADPALQRVLSKQAEALLDKVDREDEFITQFKNALNKSMQQGNPTQASVAEQLNISTRTLHRRLQEHGFQFKDILSNTRYQLAKHYLQTNQLTLSEIALLLGYSEQSAFSRAFSVWADMSPLAYQKRFARRGP